MSLQSFLYAAGLPTLALIAALILAIAFGGPKAPPPLEHIGARFDNMDWSRLPDGKRLRTEIGDDLFYRVYPGRADHVVLALHGSGGSGRALYMLASAINHGGATVIVPDIRGHGDSGRRGDVNYAGQIDDDLIALRGLIAADYPDAKITLLGFSMGGGLALRHAAQAAPDRLVLLSPYLAHDAPPMAAENPFAPPSPWASPGVGRIIGLSLLNSLGVTALDHLAVVRLATRETDAEAVASFYTHRLLRSVNPVDWRADMAALTTKPMLFVGEKDELHLASAYAEAAPDADIRILADVDHMGLTLDERAIKVIAEEVSK